jgi:hypothetical protein
MDVSEVEKWNINIITSNVNSQVYNPKQNDKVSPSSVTRSIHPFTASSIMPLESEMSPPRALASVHRHLCLPRIPRSGGRAPW